MRNPGSRFSSGLEQWTRLKGKPFVTVSPSTTPDGSDFGAFTPGTNFGGIDAALASGATKIVVQSGTYTAGATVPIASNVEVEFQNCVLKCYPSGNTLSATNGQTNFRVTGTVTIEANGSTSAFFSMGPPAGNIYWDANTAVSGFGGNWAFNFYEGSGVYFGGRLSTTDSALINANSTSRLSVAKIVAGPFTTDPAEPIVQWVNNTGAAMTDATFGELDIDGGSVLTKTPILLAPNPGTVTALRVSIGILNVRNTTGSADGIDVIHCEDVVIDRILAYKTNVGVSVLSSAVSIGCVEGDSCRSSALIVGDGSGLTFAIQNISVGMVVAKDCGIGNSGAASSGIQIAVGSGGSVSYVTIGMASTFYTQDSTLYGYSEVNNGGTISKVRLLGGSLSGYTGPYVLASNSGTQISDVIGVNPSGFGITTPAVPASGTPQKNNFPFPVEIRLKTAGTGTAYTITDPGGNAETFTVTLAEGMAWELAPGASITLTYTAAPTWVWYGE